MSKPILDQPTPKDRTKVQRAALVLAIVVPSIAAAIALPRFIGGDETAGGAVALPTPNRPAPANTTPGPEPTEAPSEGDEGLEGADEPEGTEPEADEPAGIETSEFGDLSIELTLPWSSVRTGAQLPGELSVTNHSLASLHLPAPGESFPTLAVVVLDSDGNEVHRVVEEGADPTPRRTVRVASGTVHRLPIAIQAQDDEPLPAGEYTALVEMGAHRSWSRLGLPFWSAPNGVLRSAGVRFTVTE